MRTLIDMPPEIQRERLFNSGQAAEFMGVSLAHWRRLHHDKRVPQGIRIGARKLGWRVSDLMELQRSRTYSSVLPPE